MTQTKGFNMYLPNFMFIEAQAMIDRQRDGDELTILRLRTRRNEILIAPGW